MKGLRLLPAGSGEPHQGEVFACTYTPDGGFVLSAGWDGNLRLWESDTGALITALQASPKPLSACAVSPDGRYWLSGSMEGVLSVWDAVAHQCRQTGVVHIRPISSIRFAPDGQWIATASWDRQVIIRQVNTQREGKTLSGHDDIVSGCAFTPDGRQLVSWSYDGTLCLWELETCRCLHTFHGHPDRILSADLSADGHWLASASRDGQLKLWDLVLRSEATSVALADPTACFFLLDAQTLAVAQSNGRVSLLAVPSLEVQTELDTGVKLHAAALSPSSGQMVLGGEDGRIRLLAIDGTEGAPLIVTPSRSLKAKPTVFSRLFGSVKLMPIFQFSCPACRHIGEIEELPNDSFHCASCNRLLRVDGGVRELQVH